MSDNIPFISESPALDETILKDARMDSVLIE